MAQLNNIQPKQYTISIFCDLSKAFDVINRGNMINVWTTLENSKKSGF